MEIESQQCKIIDICTILFGRETESCSSGLYFMAALESATHLNQISLNPNHSLRIKRAHCVFC